MGHLPARTRPSRPSAAIVVAVLALIAALTGTAVAADPGVTTSAITKKQVRKIAKKQADKWIAEKASELSVAHAETAGDAEAVAGHRAKCPSATTLIRGYCFDTAPRGPVSTVFIASDDCRAQGGWLPTSLMLRSVRDQLDIGDGPRPDSSYADEMPDNSFSTNIVLDSGPVLTVPSGASSEYHCVYPLVR